MIKQINGFLVLLLFNTMSNAMEHPRDNPIVQREDEIRRRREMGLSDRPFDLRSLARQAPMAAPVRAYQTGIQNQEQDYSLQENLNVLGLSNDATFNDLENRRMDLGYEIVPPAEAVRRNQALTALFPIFSHRQARQEEREVNNDEANSSFDTNNYYDHNQYYNPNPEVTDYEMSDAANTLDINSESHESLNERYYRLLSLASDATSRDLENSYRNLMQLAYDNSEREAYKEAYNALCIPQSQSKLYPRYMPLREVRERMARESNDAQELFADEQNSDDSINNTNIAIREQANSYGYIDGITPLNTWLPLSYEDDEYGVNKDTIRQDSQTGMVIEQEKTSARNKVAITRCIRFEPHPTNPDRLVTRVGKHKRTIRKVKRWRKRYSALDELNREY